MFRFLKRTKRKPFVSAIVAAGGSGTRMGQNKLLIELDSVPILIHTLLALDKSEIVDEIIIAAHKDYVVEYGKMAVDFGINKLKAVVAGGENRSGSVYNGIQNVSDNCKFVLIHDGARPFITEKDIINIAKKAFVSGAATAAVMVKDTIKEISDDKIVRTFDRSKLVQVQTPQIFDVSLINGALSRVIKEKIPVTDDCQAMEIMGFAPSVVLTSYENIKITTPEDLYIGKAILENRRL